MGRRRRNGVPWPSGAVRVSGNAPFKEERGNALENGFLDDLESQGSPCCSCCPASRGRPSRRVSSYCLEAYDPIQLEYGDHTVYCQITPSTDVDTFKFAANAGETVRINLLSTSQAFDPSVQIHFPDGHEVPGGSCSGGSPPYTSACSLTVEFETSLSGEHWFSVGDAGANEEGDYIVQLERIPPVDPHPVLSFDISENDSIDPQTDVDFFSFEGSAGASVRLNVLSESHAFDPVLEVYDPFGGQLPPDSWPTGSCSGGSPPYTSRCSFSADLELDVDGSYLVVVYDGATNEVGDYQLSLFCLGGTCDQGAEEVLYDSPVSGAIDSETDGEFFSFHGAPDSLVRVNVTSTSQAFDPRIEIRDPEGNQPEVSGPLSCSGGSPPYTSACSFSALLDIASPGWHSIALYDGGVNETGAYQLSIDCVFGPCDGDGDGIRDPYPQRLKYGKTEGGSIDPVVDGDFYTFEVSENTDVQINVTSSSHGFDPVVRIRDPNGDEVPGGSCSGGSPPYTSKCSFSVDLAAAPAGVYALELYDSERNETGGYQIALQCLFGSCSSPRDPMRFCKGGNTVGCGDNCVGQPNPDQADVDSDGVGDVCEICNDGIDNDEDGLADTGRMSDAEIENWNLENPRAATT